MPNRRHLYAWAHLQWLNRAPLLRLLTELERQQRHTPYSAKERKHPSKLGYYRYADDFVILVQGRKAEAEAIRTHVSEELQYLGLTLSAEKTKITHWRHWITFLGYQIRGKRRAKGVGIRAILAIPRAKLRTIKDALKQVSGYHHIPEADIIIQMSAMYRGWCHYYRYAKAPQADFSHLARYLWWRYAHYLARKHRSSIAKMVKRERKAGRLRRVTKHGRHVLTFQTTLGERTLTLDLFPPKTAQIQTIRTSADWQIDLHPVMPSHWQSGRSLATRMAALDRANGVCERCREGPVAHVHHTIPLRGKSFFARVTSDRDQRSTALALCKACHLEVHGGAFDPSKRRSNGSAGYAERVRRGTRC